MGACIGDNEECPLPPNTTANIVYWTDLANQNDKINGTIHCALPVGTSIGDAWKRALNRLGSYPHDDHKIWRMASTKAKSAMPEEIREIKDNLWTPEYNRSDYFIDDFFTDNSDTFQN
ncbi:hypothetical protein G9A89_018838 [Geosiphon pyriformis]|nr:hypothetical protein G9A89_018838 [Geosiphon pyriformis]